MAFFLWKAISTHIQYTMLHGPVTYTTFWTAFMEDRASLASAIRLSRDFFCKRGMYSTRGITFILTSLAYLLAFPTIASSMTGYIPRTEAFVSDVDGKPVAESDFRPVVYMMHDGPRVNMSADFIVPCEKSKWGKNQPLQTGVIKKNMLTNLLAKRILHPLKSAYSPVIYGGRSWPTCQIVSQRL